jgi:hypothetical protein
MPCSFDWWLMADADLFREKSAASWLLVAGLFWVKSTTGWWLISQANRAREKIVLNCRAFLSGEPYRPARLRERTLCHPTPRNARPENPKTPPGSDTYQPVRSAYQPPASSTFLSERTSHQQPAATSQQYSSLRTNQHQPWATSQPNRLLRHDSQSFSPRL